MDQWSPDAVLASLTSSLDSCVDTLGSQSDRTSVPSGMLWWSVAGLFWSRLDHFHSPIFPLQVNFSALNYQCTSSFSNCSLACAHHERGSGGGGPNFGGWVCILLKYLFCREHFYLTAHHCSTFFFNYVTSCGQRHDVSSYAFFARQSRWADITVCVYCTMTVC